MDLQCISAYDAALVPLTLIGLSNTVIGVISTAESDKKAQLCVPAVVAAYEVLEEWALVVPSAVVASPPVNKALFAAIEVGIFGTKLSSGGTDKGAAKKKLRDTVPAGEKAAGEEEGLSSMRARPSHGSREVSEAAEVLLRSMLNLHAQWPGPGGPEMTGTRPRQGGRDEPRVFFRQWLHCVAHSHSGPHLAHDCTRRDGPLCVGRSRSV